MMSFTRFPLLNTMRWGYRIAAGLTAVGALFLELCVVVITQDAAASLLAGLAMVVVVPAAVVSLLVMGEGIAVVLAIEDHLFYLRGGGTSSAAPVPQAGPARTWRVP